MLNNNSIAVIIPCYQVENHIEKVLRGIPKYIDKIIVINDGSFDDTKLIIKELSRKDERIIYIEHIFNRGVGAAIISGFEMALKLGMDYIIKMDGDGQMNPKYIPNFLNPLINTQVDFSKGNRFFNYRELKTMPLLRRIGNIGLSFLIKMSSGYWKILDPTNGFFCISKASLRKIDLNRIAKGYFLESSLLIELYYTGAKIVDVPIPAVYNNEKSHIKIYRVFSIFIYKLFIAFIRRIILRYFVYDFSIFSIYILMGVPLLMFGILFGLINWIFYASHDIAAPTGTIMLSILPIILGFQMLLSWIQFDMDSYIFFRSFFNLGSENDV